MLHASYEIGGLSMVILLVGIWMIKWRGRRIKIGHGKTTDVSKSNAFHLGHDIEHQALIYLMTQKTDSILAALATTIALERQKLGGIVRKPSAIEALNAFQSKTTDDVDNGPNNYDQILLLGRHGLTAGKIASRLKLSEGEVSLMMRMNAA